MLLVFSEKSWEEYLHWHRTDKTKLERIHELIKDIKRSPFKGIGKPEPLKGVLSGYWSRRINKEHRLVYLVEGKKNEKQQLYILQCHSHYGS